MRTANLRYIMRMAVAAISIVVAVMSTSCNHKDLYYENRRMSKLWVEYVWDDAPDANPSGMCVFFYSVDNGAYYRFDFNNIKGGEIELPEGKYMLITYNNDTELVKFSATNDYYHHKAFTRNADLLEPLYGNGVSSNVKTDNGEDVVITPDGLWGCHATEVEVQEHGTHYTFRRFGDSRAVTDSLPTDVDSDDQVITLYPHDMLCHYSYEVRNVENANHINRVSSAISGMSGTLNLADESLDSKTITLPLPGQANGATKQITGQFLTFGHNDDNTVAHKMTFYVVMDDGSKYVVKDSPNLDVTAQVDTAADRRHVHIIIDGLKLPYSPGSSEGWIPTVDDWGVENDDIKI